MKADWKVQMELKVSGLRREARSFWTLAFSEHLSVPETFTVARILVNSLGKLQMTTSSKDPENETAKRCRGNLNGPLLL